MHKTKMIAPCGINCGICIGYMRDKNKCLGCNASLADNKMKQCQVCVIKHCPEKEGKILFCYECKKFPCQRLKQLDKRYRTRYNTSLINNLKKIERIGIREFVKKDEKKWVCKNCGSIISIHRTICLKCGKEYVVEQNFEVDDLKKIKI